MSLIEDTNNSREKDREIEPPFYYRVIDNFVNEEEYQKLLSEYKKTEMSEKTTDLFHFYQSNELNKEKRYKWFLEKVKQIMLEDLERRGKKIENPEMSLFSSFYEKGNFLLPHDDCIEGRVMAFSFYFELDELDEYKVNEDEQNKPNESNEDNPTESDEQIERGGALAILRRDGTVYERVHPIKGRLAIFDVSEASFHEVEMVNTNRGALTGWLECSTYFPVSAELDYIPNKCAFLNVTDLIMLQEDILITIPSQLGIYGQEDYSNMIELLDGLLWGKKRLTPLQCRGILEPCHEDGTSAVVPLNIPSFSPDYIDTLAIKIEENAYMLLNDPFISIESDITVIVSLYRGEIMVLSEKDGSVAMVIKQYGYYCLPKDFTFFIPPMKCGCYDSCSGYVLAFKQNYFKPIETD